MPLRVGDTADHIFRQTLQLELEPTLTTVRLAFLALFVGVEPFVVVAVAVGVAVTVVVGTGVAVVVGVAVIGAVVVAEYTTSCTLITAAPMTTTNPSKHGGDARQAANGAAAGFPTHKIQRRPCAPNEGSVREARSSEFPDRARQYSTRKVLIGMISCVDPLFHTQQGRERQEALGQFFTPSHVAEFMASLFDPLPASVRIIDAGAGAGALVAAFVRRACVQGSGVESIHVTAYEIDPVVLPVLRETLAACEALCQEHGITYAGTIRHADFIREIAEKLSGDLFRGAPPSFNLAIVNPPYRKINTNSTERVALRAVGLETSNLYTGFVGLLAGLLEDGGQLVAITPRSFCNGPYFRPFRQYFLDRMNFRRLHVFESRNTAFRGDGVLQENIVFHALRARAQSPTVIISSSSGNAGASITAKSFPFTEIVNPNDPEQFIHMPADADHATATAALSKLPSTLDALGLTVSTGRVVDFRLKDSLRLAPSAGTVPLLYPCHFNGGTIHWPRPEARKPNAILDNETTRPWLVPSGIYLLTKRFTSKEERRRLVACIFDPTDIEAEWLGFENHLNYFHARGKGLGRPLALGLLAYLNSTLVDQHFRCFSGHTQVNATDLRNLPYPDRATLEAMGCALSRTDIPQEELDQLVRHHLNGIE